MSPSLRQDLVRCLTDDTPPRVWSLLVTVFGDLAQASGAQVSGRALSTLCDAIGIKPEALRVALHRLRKDGWIESHRTGRHSSHGLTTSGFQQSAAATPRIYDPAPPDGPVWLSLLDRTGTTDPPGGVWVAPNTLVSMDHPGRNDIFTTRIDAGDRLPDWMTEKICPPALLAHATTFANGLDACTDLLARHPTRETVDIAVLRVLIVHGWRRVILKAPLLPDHVFPERWPGARCRRQVQRLLTDHPRVDLSTLGP